MFNKKKGLVFLKSDTDNYMDVFGMDDKTLGKHVKKLVMLNAVESDEEGASKTETLRKYLADGYFTPESPNDYFLLGMIFERANFLMTQLSKHLDPDHTHDDEPPGGVGALVGKVRIPAGMDQEKIKKHVNKKVVEATNEAFKELGIEGSAEIVGEEEGLDKKGEEALQRLLDKHKVKKRVLN